MKKILYWLPAVIWMAVIYGFSAQPSLRVSQISWTDFIIRKTAHFVEYFVLFNLYFYAFKNTANFSNPKNLGLSLALAIIYAVTDELHQLSVYGREGRVQDVIIDSFGSVSGWFFARR